MAPIDEFPGLPERILKIITPSTQELEFRSRLYPDVSVVESSKIICTICLKDVKPMFLLKKKTYKHLLLKVAVCKGCLEFYGDGQFSDDDGEDKYCRWCGQGGILYLCSDCPSCFCKKCIKRNFDREFLELVEEDDWKCFFCDPQPLFKLRALVWAIDQHLALQKKKLKLASTKNKTSTPKAKADKSALPSQQLPNVDEDVENFQLHLARTKEWLLGLHQELKIVGDSMISQLNKVEKDIASLNRTADLNMVTKSLSNIVDSTSKKAASIKSKLIDNVVKLSLEISKTEETEPQDEESNIVFYDETIDDSAKDMFDSTIPLTGTSAVAIADDVESNDSDLRPTIRLRNLSDLIDPKLKGNLTPVKTEVQLVENGKSKAFKKTETINISSDDDDIFESVVRKTSKKSDPLELSTSKTVKSIRRNSLKINLSKEHIKKKGTAALKTPPNHVSESECEASPTSSETIVVVTNMDFNAPLPDSKNDSDGETLKLNSEVRTSGESLDSSSSSDPLSEDSSSKDIEFMESSQKKLKCSKSSDKEDDCYSTDRRKKSLSTIGTSDSDESTDVDCLKILRKRKVMKQKKSVNANSTTKQNSNKEDAESSEDSNYSIKKLCSFSSLTPKRIHSTSESSSVDDNKSDTGKRKNHKKTKKDEPSVMDFYNGDDVDDREQPDSDLEATFRREFNLDDTASFQALRTSIQQMSSSDEEEPGQQPKSEEIAAPKKKSVKKLDKQSTPKANISKEKPKVKKRYFDKLLNMKIDSDSEEEAKKNDESYMRSLEKQAEAKVNESSGSDKDDSLVASKKTASKKKSRRKMFMDSDESSDENNEEESNDLENDVDIQSGSDSQEEDDNAVSKRKMSSSDSDASEKSKKGKKRKRIKGAKSDSSSGSEDSSGNKKDKLTDSASKGRKNIRRVLKEDDLKQTTLAALKAEQDRKRRIAEKQEFYNKFLEVEEAHHKELKELVLDFDSKTKEKILVVDPDLVKKLKPHQAEGIKFMWDSCFETVAMAKKKSGSGCILAHCMGLGKTLQVITLIHTLITNPEIGIRTILVVSPVSTVLNWANEFDKWLKDVGSGEDVNVFHMTKTPASHRTYVLKDWEKAGGVLIMGYNLLRTLLNPKGRIKPSFKKVYQERLLDPGPDMVICDEGHILKNEKTALSVAMAKMKTRRRIVLTGTPLQNNLVEYHCMVQFVKPDLLGTKKEFTNRFVNPIQNGQFEDSTQHDVRVMKRRAHVLHTMLDGIVQRKDYNVLTPYLPPKYEYVIHLKLSDVQVKLYRYYLLNMVQQTTDSDSGATVPKGRRLFMDFQTLMWICLHPRTLLMKMAKDEKKAELEETDEEGSLKDFIDDESDFKTSSSSSSESFDSGSGSEKEGKKKSAPPRRRTRGQGSISEPEEEPPQPAKQWWSDLVQDEHMDDIRQSSKLFLFFTILKYCEEIGDKLLVFSQSLYTLDLIEYFLDRVDTDTQKSEEERAPGLKGFEGSWAKGLDYFRLDGSSACENRDSWCKSFNRPDNTRARLFLISTRAGGLGINLTGANRVIIFDASWNPSFDVQSLFRVYRFGQGKPCYIYRFLSKGTMEEKIYERQVAKLSTSLRVIDEQQIDRHFSHSALAELYMFDPEGSELQGTPVLPKDRLMAELLQNHKDIILSHHQHDSLLENQEDQELSEEERKAAWTEFENEKTQRAPPVNMSFNLGAMASMMVEIRTKLKQQNPQWTEEQLRLGALQILQRYPDYNQMAPYLTFLIQATQMQQQNPIGGIAPGGSYTMNQGALMPQFPGMTFPHFRYPIYTTNNPQMSASTGVGTASGTTTQNPMLNSLLVNPKHLQAMQNQAARATLQQSAAPNNGTAGNSKEPTGTGTDPIAIIDD